MNGLFYNIEPHTELEETLNKCPFCGGEPQVNLYIKKFYVRCEKCGAQTKDFNTQEEARAAWNKRF